MSDTDRRGCRYIDNRCIVRHIHRYRDVVGRVTLLGGPTFCHVNTWDKVTLLDWSTLPYDHRESLHWLRARTARGIFSLFCVGKSLNRVRNRRRTTVSTFREKTWMVMNQLSTRVRWKAARLGKMWKRTCQVKRSHGEKEKRPSESAAKKPRKLKP